MCISSIQFQAGLSLPEFTQLYGTEENCEAALEQARWPEGFRYHRCECKEYRLIHGRRHMRYQCRSCRHQPTLTAGTHLDATKLPLTTWFLAFYLVGQAKTGISSLALRRHLGVKYRTAWLVQNKIARCQLHRRARIPNRRRTGQQLPRGF
jgi:transposase-like protein